MSRTISASSAATASDRPTQKTRGETSAVGPLATASGPAVISRASPFMADGASIATS